VNNILGRRSPKATVPKAMMGVLAKGLRVLNLFGVDLHFTPELVRQVSTWYLYVSSAKAELELGYKPHRIDQAISATIEWLKAEKRIS
jgi:nucleoside-diphosphate-sugar epimerase